LAAVGAVHSAIASRTRSSRHGRGREFGDAAISERSAPRVREYALLTAEASRPSRVRRPNTDESACGKLACWDFVVRIKRFVTCAGKGLFSGAEKWQINWFWTVNRRLPRPLSRKPCRSRKRSSRFDGIADGIRRPTWMKPSCLMVGNRDCRKSSIDWSVSKRNMRSAFDRPLFLRPVRPGICCTSIWFRRCDHAFRWSGLVILKRAYLPPQGGRCGSKPNVSPRTAD